MNVSSQIKECKAKIADLEFKLAVEQAVLMRFTAIGNNNQIATRHEPRPIIADSIAPHIKSVLMHVLLPLRATDITCCSDEALCSLITRFLKWFPLVILYV